MVSSEEGLMRRMRRGVMLALVAMWLIASCGQSGPLYLPDEEEKDEEKQTSMLPPRQA